MEQCIIKLTNLLQRWKSQMAIANYNPTPTLIQLCELFEVEIKNFTLKYPDPSDKRHPSDIDPTCALVRMYNILFSKDFLVKELLMDYLKEHYWPRRTKDNHDLNVAACRLIINIIPHNLIADLETPVILENPELIQSLFAWAENTSEPLQTYATGLLASCMELSKIADNLKEHNNKLVPIILDRLHSYYTQFCKKNKINQRLCLYQNTNSDQPNNDTESEKNGICDDSSSSSTESDASNWIQIHPPTLTTKLVYCLKYLASIGKHQEFLNHAYKKNAHVLVMKIINSSDKQNGYLTFEALKYLTVLLCHKIFATEFFDSQGLQELLLIPKLSIPSIGVSICFCYLSYSEKAMERICLLPEHVLVDIVKYALWMLECSHNIIRCHATIFFSNSLHFRVIHKIFDSHDGLRKLFNVVITLPILPSEDPAYSSLTESTKYSPRQTICSSLKHYFETHLHIEAQKIHRGKIGESFQFVSSTMSTKKSLTEVQEDIELLSNDTSLVNHWTPIDQFLKLGGLSLLLQIISRAGEQNFSGRFEIINDALEVLNICAVLQKVKLALCEKPSTKVKVDNQNDISTVDYSQAGNNNVGLYTIIKIVEEDLLNADIKKAALHVIITCVCVPIHKECDEAMIEKIWDCIRNYNGIMVLITLITRKTPITDIDALRGLACRALAGLARSESVNQIISKLPLFNDGQLQSLMKNPVLQEKQQEHATFKKYALHLMKLVLRGENINGAEIETSLANINRANVVAQTKIHFDVQQLHFLIYQYLMKNGWPKTAESFVQEANLNIAEKKSTQFKSYTERGPENCPIVESDQEFESPMSKSVDKKIDRDLTLLNDNNTYSKVSLESIVTEYLTNQHASCKNPMVTCPQFNLLVSHKCPDSNRKSSMSTNFAMRFSKNIHSRKLNQRLIHSRFCPTRHFRMTDEKANSTCCEFLSKNRVVIGTDNGEIRVFNLFTSQKEVSFSAHFSYIKDLQCSNDERMLLSSSSWGMPLLSFWCITEDAINIKHSYYLKNEEYCVFSNYDQNKILGTKEKIATIYDLETSKQILKLVPRLSNEYRRNRAVFDTTNELVLSDGVLWDAITGREIHKFDKLNQYVNGIFHPNGLEIISNTEVWDIRTFKLLHSVSSLNECDVTFSKSGEGMYLYDNNPGMKYSYQTAFKTLDPNDYSDIATIDVKNCIYHIACNSSDTQIAIVENQGMLKNSDVIVQLYDVGRSRTEDEAVEKEDYEEVDSES